jgi:hydrogenase maturation protein HypF
MPTLSVTERQLLQVMLERGIHAPLTSSVGRLFDAVAFLTGAATRNSFDGQAGMALEALAETATATDLLTYQLQPGRPFQLDPVPMLLGLLQRLQAGEPVASLAWAFHASLAMAVVDGCALIRKETGLDRVALSGGVFQNRLLTELVYTFLAKSHFSVFIHRLVPPNDGGICLGQAAIAARRS